MRWARDQRRRQRRAFDIAVVANDARDKRRLDQRRVFVRRVAVVDRNRRVVDGRDRDAHRRDIAVERPVVDLVGEAIRPVVVGIRRVGECAIGIEGERAVAGPRHKRRRQRIAINIAIATGQVADDAGCCC